MGTPAAMLDRAALEQMLAHARATVAQLEAALCAVGEASDLDRTEPAETLPAAADWVTPQQAADHLGVHETTVTEWLRTGRLPGIKPRGRWRVRRQDVE